MVSRNERIVHMMVKQYLRLLIFAIWNHSFIKMVESRKVWFII